MKASKKAAKRLEARINDFEDKTKQPTHGQEMHKPGSQKK